MALGARSSDLVALVVRQAATLAAAGLAGGLVGALLLTGFLSTQLFGVTPTDPATFAAVATILFVVALAATVAPAHRAASVDPIASLRRE
jgi:ABC-type antimicrobial peptide transport system permease subunit